jgi:hypothetical protein
VKEIQKLYFKAAIVTGTILGGSVAVTQLERLGSQSVGRDAFHASPTIFMPDSIPYAADIDRRLYIPLTKYKASSFDFVGDRLAYVIHVSKNESQLIVSPPVLSSIFSGFIELTDRATENYLSHQVDVNENNIAFLFKRYASAGIHLSIYEGASGTVFDVPEDISVRENTLAWTYSGSRLAFIGRHKDITEDQLFTYDSGSHEVSLLDESHIIKFPYFAFTNDDLVYARNQDQVAQEELVIDTKAGRFVVKPTQGIFTIEGLIEETKPATNQTFVAVNGSYNGQEISFVVDISDVPEIVPDTNNNDCCIKIYSV